MNELIRRRAIGVALAWLGMWAPWALAEAAPADFRALLTDAGVTEQDFAAFDSWAGSPSSRQAILLSRIYFRLGQLRRGEILGAGADLSAQDRTSKEPASPGQLVRLAGYATSIVPVTIPEETRAEFGDVGLFLCVIEAEDQRRWLVLTPRVPRAWLRRDGTTALRERVKLAGVVLKAAGAGDSPECLLAADWLEWYPDAKAPSGVRWLVRQGFDAALLDEVRQNQAFAKPDESDEGRAFYEALAATARGDRRELMDLAEQEVRARAEASDAAKPENAKRQAMVREELAAAAGDAKGALERELVALQRRQAVAQAMRERANIGLSSVWSMFVEAPESVGEVFLIEGTARRAVRVVVEGNPSLKEYYELDVFTTDAPHNQPLICCVAQLPKGFPRGEVIRESVRLAGVFFKRWAYARRQGAGRGDRADLPDRLAPPLLLAAEPDWLRTVESAEPSRIGAWGGLAFLGTMAAAWAAMARISRADRLAKSRRARYDAPLEEMNEP